MPGLETTRVLPLSITKIQSSKRYFVTVFSALVTAGDGFALEVSFGKDLNLQASFKPLIQRSCHQGRHHHFYPTASFLPERGCSMGCPVSHTLPLFSVSVSLTDSPGSTEISLVYREKFRVFLKLGCRAQ